MGKFALALTFAALLAYPVSAFSQELQFGRTAFKSTPVITIIIITMRARAATAGNCAQPAYTKRSWENRVKGTVNVIAGCADN